MDAARLGGMEAFGKGEAFGDAAVDELQPAATASPTRMLTSPDGRRCPRGLVVMRPLLTCNESTTIQQAVEREPGRKFTRIRWSSDEPEVVCQSLLRTKPG
jgi:hypothetical protein